MLRTLTVLLLLATWAKTQTPIVHVLNTSRPGSAEFQVGDRFEISVSGTARQPISVRTTMAGRTDWGPTIGSTDGAGRWSISGRFEKRDFGDWSEVWTVGNKLATPTVHFTVQAPCLPTGKGFMTSSGQHWATACETLEGPQTYSTPSDSEPFHTPDGRFVVPGSRAGQTQKEYQTHSLQYLICSSESMKSPVALHTSKGGLGDGTADLILKLIGVNALNADETRNVLAILRAAFQRPDTLAPDQRVPARSELLLQRLKDFTDQPGLQGEIDATAEYVRAR